MNELFPTFGYPVHRRTEEPHGDFRSIHIMHALLRRASESADEKIQAKARPDERRKRKGEREETWLLFRLTIKNPLYIQHTHVSVDLFEWGGCVVYVLVGGLDPHLTRRSQPNIQTDVLSQSDVSLFSLLLSCLFFKGMFVSCAEFFPCCFCRSNACDAATHLPFATSSLLLSPSFSLPRFYPPRMRTSSQDQILLSRQKRLHASLPQVPSENKNTGNC